MSERTHVRCYSPERPHVFAAEFFPGLRGAEKIGRQFRAAHLVGLVARECILDLHAFHSVTAEDVTKRLMNYGFREPTIS